MSHWTKTKTKLNNLDFMKKALKRMGVNWTEGGQVQHSYNDDQGGRVDINIDSNIGLRKENDGTISIVGDHYYSRFRDAGKFQENMTKNYLVEEAFSKVEEQGFYVYENEEATVGDDGLIRMRARAQYVE
jgi:hypothetical protein